jgi:type IV pilus assembly protein PilC
MRKQGFPAHPKRGLEFWQVCPEFRGVSLSYGEKQRFFTNLAQLLRSGTALPKALETLKRTSSGSVRTAVKKLLRQIENDATAADAFRSLNPDLGQMERATLSAAAGVGRLDYTLTRLADYFQKLMRARRAMIANSAYPVFVLHFGILVWHVSLVITAGVGPYLKATLPIFGWVWGVAFVLMFLVPVLNDLGANIAVIDDFLRDLPLFGKVRRCLSVARFCGTLDMQLDAGVNVIDSILTAAEASRSGMLHRAVQRGLPRLRDGESVGEILADYPGAVPREALESFLVGEQSGMLHESLPQLQSRYEEEGLNRLDTLSVWLPRLLYFGVACFVGWQIISFYLGYFKALESL